MGLRECAHGWTVSQLTHLSSMAHFTIGPGLYFTAAMAYYDTRQILAGTQTPWSFGNTSIHYLLSTAIRTCCGEYGGILRRCWKERRIIGRVIRIAWIGQTLK